jgi:hypothetical protein
MDARPPHPRRNRESAPGLSTRHRSHPRRLRHDLLGFRAGSRLEHTPPRLALARWRSLVWRAAHQLRRLAPHRLRHLPRLRAISAPFSGYSPARNPALAYRHPPLRTLRARKRPPAASPTASRYRHGPRGRTLAHSRHPPRLRTRLHFHHGIICARRLAPHTPAGPPRLGI